ncbi:hypothetical protein M407DRAFT_25532 [Tulasnella calospora MUT 4182]|uniref:Uncharacterized protein n=1 Tax=Tulasnella calospora MUT 4182 TaxID=1051891 RepID=A0A0C3QHA9_9AGAM|nr:hypothetical protein M407DRAFT_25532 [Tulasnella calospora MUT 4182]
MARDLSHHVLSPHVPNQLHQLLRPHQMPPTPSCTPNQSPSISTLPGKDPYHQKKGSAESKEGCASTATLEFTPTIAATSNTPVLVPTPSPNNPFLRNNAPTTTGQPSSSGFQPSAI